MDVGIGSVFEDFSTYQGKKIGSDGGPKVTVNPPASQNANQFDFDFNAPAGNSNQQSAFDIDSILNAGGQ